MKDGVLYTYTAMCHRSWVAGTSMLGVSSIGNNDAYSRFVH